MRVSLDLSGPDGTLGVREFRIAAMVATIVDEFLGRLKIGGRRCPWILHRAQKEASAVKVDIGHEKLHWAAPGNFPSFLKITLRTLRASVWACEKAQPTAREKDTRDLMQTQSDRGCSKHHAIPYWPFPGGAWPVNSVEKQSF